MFFRCIMSCYIIFLVEIDCKDVNLIECILIFDYLFSNCKFDCVLGI